MNDTSYGQNNQQQQLQSLKESKFKIEQIDYSRGEFIFTSAISDNLKYILAGGSDKLLKIWDYKNHNLIKSIIFENNKNICKFTADSQLLYVGVRNILYQFFVLNQFKRLCRWDWHVGEITNIICQTNMVILTSPTDTYIIKSDILKKQQLLKIYATQSYETYVLDFSQKLNLIVSVSIRFGYLIIEKLQDNDKTVKQVLFIIKSNQLITLNLSQNLIIYNIRFSTKQLEQLLLIKNTGYNMSLVIQQQYIIAMGKRFLKIYTINGESLKYYSHLFEDFRWFNIIQLESMKAILIQGHFILQVWKLATNSIE